MNDNPANLPTLPPTADQPTQAPAADFVPPPMPGLPSMPGFVLLDELGRGGMGVVYKATQEKLNRTVALKMILAGAHASGESLGRFKAEAEAVAKLQHPNIVQVFEVGEHEGKPFFALEFVAGGSLAARLRGEPQPPRDAAMMVETLARAMHHAHEQGIVHRDLKPANILLSVSRDAERGRSRGGSSAPLRVAANQVSWAKHCWARRSMPRQNRCCWQDTRD